MPMDGGIPMRTRLQSRMERVKDLSPAMRVIGEEMVARGHEALRARRSQTGEPFATLAPSTLAKRAAKLPGARRRSKKTGRLTKGARAKREAGIANPAAIVPLIDTGRMRASQRYRLLGKTGLRWSVVGYAGYHIGGAPRANIPARNFSPIERIGTSNTYHLNAPMRTYAAHVLRRYISEGVAAP